VGVVVVSCGVSSKSEKRMIWYDWYDHKKPQRNAKQSKAKQRKGKGGLCVVGVSKEVSK
jgi:hypothetical protein